MSLACPVEWLTAIQPTRSGSQHLLGVVEICVIATQYGEVSPQFETKHAHLQCCARRFAPGMRQSKVAGGARRWVSGAMGGRGAPKCLAGHGVAHQLLQRRRHLPRDLWRAGQVLIFFLQAQHAQCVEPGGQTVVAVAVHARPCNTISQACACQGCHCSNLPEHGQIVAAKHDDVNVSYRLSTRFKTKS